MKPDIESFPNGHYTDYPEPSLSLHSIAVEETIYLIIKIDQDIGHLNSVDVRLR